MNNTKTDFLAPVGRLLISLIFLLSGLGKIFTLEQSQQYMESVGVPGILLFPTIAFEILASLAVILGWKTRTAAALLAGFSIATAALFHSNVQDQVQMTMFLKNLSIAGAFLFIVATGPGAFSIDKRR